MLMEAFLFSIKSTSSDRELAFSAVRENQFTVEVRSNELRAIREVSSYMDALGLPKLFTRLATHERPWVGSDDWSSFEGEFSLSASCDRLGHVTFSVTICGEPGAADTWQVSTSLTAELGQLQQMAKDANRLFGLHESI